MVGLMKYNIPFIYPDFPDPADLAGDLKGIIERNHFTNSGPLEKRFSEEIVRFVKNTEAKCSLVANATSGLILAIKALCDKNKKYIIIPSFTFAAGAEAITWNGFTPLLIDIERSNLQPSLEECIKVLEKNKNIAGILLCNSFGVGNVDIGKWELIAKEHNVPLIIDSAAGFGSKYFDNEILGCRGDCEIFSFHATKPMGIGEGGAVVTRNEKLYKQIESLKNFGFSSDRTVEEIGLNAKLDEFSSAIGIRQIQRLDESIKNRQSKFTLFKDILSPIGVEFQKNAEISTVAFVTCLLPEKIKPLKVIGTLELLGIQTRSYYNPPLHEHNAIAKISEVYSSLDVTNVVCSGVVSFPSHKMVTVESIKEIAKVIKDEVAI